jgi:hypothetical protein
VTVYRARRWVKPLDGKPLAPYKVPPLPAGKFTHCDGQQEMSFPDGLDAPLDDGDGAAQLRPRGE